MDIGIIGAGNIGGTLAELLGARGHDVRLANSRGPETLTEQVAELEGVEAATAEEAASHGEVVIEAIPFGAYDELPASTLEDTIVVSASNYYRDRDGEIELGGRADTELVAEHLAGARVVKAFNTIYWEHLRDQGDPELPDEQRRVVPLAGDDPVAKGVVAELIAELGFAPADTGDLHEGGLVQQPGSAIYNEELRGGDFFAALAEARGDDDDADDGDGDGAPAEDDGDPQEG